MELINPSFVPFLIFCVIGLSGFVVWLVKKIIHLTEDCTRSMNKLDASMTKLETAVNNNTSAHKELRELILTKI